MPSDATTGGRSRASIDLYPPAPARNMVVAITTSDTAAGQLRDGILTLLSPLSLASTPEGAARLLASIGRVGAVAEDPGLRGELVRLAQLSGGLADLTADDLESWGGIARLLELAREVMGAVRDARTTLADPALADEAGELGADLGERLLALYLRAEHPALFRAAALLALMTPGERSGTQPMVTTDGGRLQRLPWARDEVHLERARELIDDPAGYFAALYLPGGMARAGDAHLGAEALFPLLLDLAGLSRVRVVSDFERVAPELPDFPDGEPAEFPDWPPPEDDDPAPDNGPVDLTAFHRDHRPRLVIELPPVSPGPDTPARLGVAIVASSAEHPDQVQGYLVQLFGGVGWTEDRGAWRVSLVADGEIPAASIGPGGVRLGPGQVPGAAFTATLTAGRIAEPDSPAVRVGGADASRLEIGTLDLSAELTLSATRQAVEAAIDAGSALLVLAGGDDGLLSALLPADGLRFPFDLGVILSSDRGLRLRGGAGLAVAVPASVRMGPVSLDGITLTLAAAADGVHLDAGSTISASIGPIEAVIEGLGIRLRLDTSADGGTLGPVDLDAQLLPPRGAGLSVDAGVITGGGFVDHDPVTGRYFGMLDLRIGDIDVTGVSLVDTRLPDGHGGFALLVALRATFPAVQIGFGFALTGIGGLLAINHRIDVDALRDRLAAGTAGRVLAPQDPIRNAPALLADLDTVFPRARGVTVVGPTAQLLWAGLVHLDVGIFIELPGPTRVVLLGSAHAEIARDGRTYLAIRVDIVGVMDLRAETAKFDAVLIDSHLLGTLDVTGGAAFRLSWGAQPYVVLTLGGFHPGYRPEPLTFPPSLTRIAMVHGAPSDDLYLRFEGYFALTSNTMQFGAAVQVVIHSGNFSIVGALAFDALIQFVPFHFQFDIRASVHVKYKSRSLGGLTLTGSLSGPGPVVLRAKVCIELLFFDICFSGTFQLGPSTPPPVAAPGDLLTALLGELDDPSRLRAGGAADRYVTLRAPDPALASVVVPPTGALVWEQQHAPLDLLVTRVGGAPLPVPVRVAATGTVAAAAETDWFAPGQFVDLTDDQALTRPSYERLGSGLRLGADGVSDGPSRQRTLTIRQILLPSEHAAVTDVRAFPAWLVDAPAARSATTPPVVVHDEIWTVSIGAASTGDLTAAQARRLADVTPGAVAIPAVDRLAAPSF